MRQLQCRFAATLSGLAVWAVCGPPAGAEPPTGYYIPPKFNHQVYPVYSDAARAAHETGTVQVKILVGADGKPKNFSIFHSSGHKDLDNAVLSAVRASTYVPASNNAKPATAFYDVTYRFTLRGLAQNEGSESDLGKRLGANRSDIASRLQLATIYINKKNYTQAESVLQEGTRFSPKSAKMWARLGIAYYQDASQNNASDKYKMASDAFDRALALDSRVETGGTAAAAYGRYAFDLLQQQQYDAALPYAQKAAQLNPKLMDYKMLLGQTEAAQRNFEAALSDFKAAQALDDKRNTTKTVILLTSLGNAQLAMGNETEGVASINEAERMDAHSPFPYQALSRYYLSKGNINAALSPLKQLELVQPNSAQVKVDIGDVYFSQKNYTAAQASYAQAQTLEPQNANAQFGLAKVAATQGQTAVADANFAKAIAAAPKNAAIYETILADIYLGVTLDKVNHTADGFKYAQQATAADPNYARAWIDLGVAYADQNKKTESNGALRKAYALFKVQHDKAAMDAVNQLYKKQNGSDIPQ